MKILVADDESIIRMGLKSMLGELGHVAILARDGREALQKAFAYRPDLALLDIQMPKTNGLQLARALNKHYPLPIIFLTAFSQDDLIAQATDLQVQGYLIKPVGSAELKAAIMVAHKRFHDQQNEVTRREKAEQRLADRKVIDRAKGILMQSGLTESAAYHQLQQTARECGQTIAEVAEGFIKKQTPTK